MVERAGRTADLVGEYKTEHFAATLRRLGFEKDSMGALEWAKTLVEALGFSWTDFRYSAEDKRCVISQEQSGLKGKWGTWRWQLEMSEDGYGFRVNSVPFSFEHSTLFENGFYQESSLQPLREQV